VPSLRQAERPPSDRKPLERPHRLLK
jgi:hypothetical protein